MWIKQLSNRKVQDFFKALRAQKVSLAFGPLVLRFFVIWLCCKRDFVMLGLMKVEFVLPGNGSLHESSLHGGLLSVDLL